MPDPITAITGGSAILGASSASKAASAQKKAANQQMELERETRDIIRGDLAPYRGAGDNALAALQFELGLGPRPTFGGTAPAIQEISDTIQGTAPTQIAPWWGKEEDRPTAFSGGTPTQTRTRYSVGGQMFDSRDAAQAYADANPTGGTEYGGYTKTPGYDFRLNQGIDAVEASRAGQSGLLSGRTLRDLTQYGQDYATGEYNNYLARLGGFTDMGLSAAQMQGAASQNAAAGMSNALSNKANAQSAGAIGVGNAIQGGIQNGLALWQYQKGLTPSASAPMASPRPTANPFY